MFSLIRHFPITHLYSKPTGPAWMYRKTRACGCLLGEMGWVVLLIGNKRLWLSSLPLFFFVHAMDWTGRRGGKLSFLTAELKVDIVLCLSTAGFEEILVTSDVGLVLRACFAPF
jgi:hypothetical protein